MAQVQVVSSTHKEPTENRNPIVPGMYYINNGVNLDGSPAFNIILATKYEYPALSFEGVVIHTNNPMNKIGEVWDQWSVDHYELFNGSITVRNCDESEVDDSDDDDCPDYDYNIDDYDPCDDDYEYDHERAVEDEINFMWDLKDARDHWYLDNYRYRYALLDHRTMIREFFETKENEEKDFDFLCKFQGFNVGSDQWVRMLQECFGNRPVNPDKGYKPGTIWEQRHRDITTKWYAAQQIKKLEGRAAALRRKNGL